MPNAKKVLAICVNWNGAEVLPRTLECLQETDYPHFEVLVVDNASGDGSQRLVPPTMTRLQMPENRGYGGAINAALLSRTSIGRGPARETAEGTSDPDYFLILNNDVTFAPGMLTELIGLAEKTPPGVWGPKVLRDDSPDRLEASWGEVTWSHVLCAFRSRNGEDRTFARDTIQVQLLLGCFLLIHPSVFEKVGLFDETFFMYHEEVDFLFRTRRKGLPVYFCPGVQIRHRGASSTRRTPLKKIYWVRKNTVLFFRKHRASLSQWLHFAVTLASSLVFNLLTFRWRRLAVIVRGVIDGYREKIVAR